MFVLSTILAQKYFTKIFETFIFFELEDSPMMFKFDLQEISRENFPREFPYALLLQRLQKGHKRQEISSEQIFCLFLVLCKLFPEI